MARYWKEPYTVVKARRLEIRDWGNHVIIGQCWKPEREWYVWDTNGGFLRCGTEPNVLLPLTEYRNQELKTPPVNNWIYYVYVCRFTFAFFSLEEIADYIQYYSTKILPSRKTVIHDRNHAGGQSRFNRLPLYLRKDTKRLRVVKALQQAYTEFQKQEKDTPSVVASFRS